MAKETKKSYNPFKMLGSWVGFITGILLSGSLLITTEYLIKLNYLFNLNPIMWFLVNCNDLGGIPIIIISTTIIYFLIGWLIHSLIRRFKK